MFTIQKQIQTTDAFIPAVKRIVSALQMLEEDKCQCEIYIGDFDHTITLHKDMSESEIQFEYERLNESYFNWIL